MVIIAFVFSVVPKMFQISNKSLGFSTKEDALFNMYSEMMNIVLKEYDENNTKYDDILLTGKSGILECNSTTGYRTGGFAGSRNCFNKVYESNIGADDNEPPYDDIDDYNGINNIIQSGNREYNISVTAGYTDNWNSDNYNYNNGSLDFNFTKTSNNSKSQIKRICVKILSGNKEISSLSYDSANIGHIDIRSVKW